MPAATITLTWTKVGLSEKSGAGRFVIRRNLPNRSEWKLLDGGVAVCYAASKAALKARANELANAGR